MPINQSNPSALAADLLFLLICKESESQYVQQHKQYDCGWY